jgi:hypothetical protein
VSSIGAVLKNYRWPGGGDLKRCQPALAQRLAAAKASECREVTIRKCYIEPFHARSVFKLTGGDALLDLERDVAIEGGEEPETIAVGAGAKNDFVEFGKDFIDCLWGHG